MMTPDQMEAEIVNLRRTVETLEVQVAQLSPGGGTTMEVSATLRDSTYIGRFKDFLKHGSHAQEGFAVNKFCIPFGPEKGVTGIDPLRKTGQVGMVLGNGGEFVSKWDHA